MGTPRFTPELKEEAVRQIVSIPHNRAIHI